jgi:hypothetical protein
LKILGDISFGLDIRTASWLKEALNVDTFVETGTYKGQTSHRMARVFKNVFTVEGSEFYFKAAVQNLINDENVSITNSDSVSFLEGSIWNYKSAIFWLDAHWCGTETAGVENECPLIAEIGALKKIDLNNSAILIDDARLFLKPPPEPHKIEQWPTLREVLEQLPTNHQIFIHNDVIFSVPMSISRNFTEFLRESGEVTQTNRIPLFSGLIQKFYRIVGLK